MFNLSPTDNSSEYLFWQKDQLNILDEQFLSPWVGISGTTAKSRKRKFVHSSHPGPFALVTSPGKSKTKVGTLACFDFL